MEIRHPPSSHRARSGMGEIHLERCQGLKGREELRNTKWPSSQRDDDNFHSFQKSLGYGACVDLDPVALV